MRAECVVANKIALDLLEKKHFLLTLKCLQKQMPRIHYSSRQHTQNAELEFINPPPNPSFFPLRFSLFSFDCQLTFFSFFILEKMTFTIPRTVSPCLAMSFCCLKMNYFARFQPCHIQKFLPPSSNNTE